MNIPNQYLDDLIKSGTDMLRKSGKIAVTTRAGGRLDIEEKEVDGVRSPTTRVDRGLDKYATRRILQAHKRLSATHHFDASLEIISEESYESGRTNVASNTQLVVQLDALDGTQGYTKGFSNFVHQFILLDWTQDPPKPILALIYKPKGYDQERPGEDKEREELIIARAGAGAILKSWYKTGKPNYTEEELHVTDKQELKDIKIVTNQFILRPEILQALNDSANSVENVGSTGNKFALVAKGKDNIGAYVFPAGTITHPWDVNPGMFALQEVGGVVTDMRGNPISLKKGTYVHRDGICATANKELQDKVLKIFNS
jgi:fructose-1,6-bisphosphatase/inositol monophosphatase family enzyme